MKKLVTTLVLGAVCGSAQAGEWVLGPAFKPGWKPEFTVAAIGGMLDPATDGADSGSYMGAEISLNCPWFQPPTGAIRQQFWLGRYEENNVELQTIEINPRYYTDLGNGLSFGFGPGFGYAKADVKPFAEDIDMFTLQAGADINYRNGMFYAGIGTRYQWTTDKLPGDENADNWVLVGKIGVNF